MKKILAGLDISEDFVTCSVCSTEEKDTLALLGYASVPSRGIDNGAISDISEVALSVASAVEKAEASAKTKVVSLVTNCDGASLRVYNTKGSVTVAEKENEISRHEVERVTEAARTIALPFDREIVHSITRDFILDGQDGIKDPTGMFGTRLEADMEFVTALVTNLHNVRRSINTAGFEIRDIVLSGIAAGYAILEELEKELGVIFIFISYSATHMIVYNGGEIKSIEIIPAGSGRMAELIADNFKIPRDYAADLLKREISLDKPATAEPAQGSASPEGDKIVLRLGGSSRSLSRRALAEAARPEAEELIKQIGGKLKDMLFAKEAAMGCVVAGDLTALGGFLEMLELSLSMPVKMGLVKGVTGGDMARAGTGQVTSVGLVKYWAREGAKRKVRKNIFGNTPLGKLFDRVNRIFSEYF
ncbi:MAG: cell division protein FtsA [Candidatus Omnitrophica bacterium]|nr:cell division protein FtsA [Candidatus Omnitrophota bacterium]